MKGLKVCLFLICAVLVNKISAQEQPHRLTLAEAREYALQHNKTLLNARDQVTSSKKKVMETVARGLPQIDGALDYMTYFGYELDFGFGSTGTPNIDYTQLDAGDIQVLSALAQMFGPSEPIVMDDQFSGKIQLSQLIFSGQYIAGVQTAKIAVRLYDQSLVKSELDVKENIMNSYYVILTTEKTLQIITQTLDNLNRLLELTNNLYRAGAAEVTDVDRLKMSVNELKNTQKSVERMNQLNYNLMKFQLGVAPETEIVLVDSLEQIMGFINPDTRLSSSFNFNENIDYQLIETQVMLSKKQVDLQNWNYTPTVAGFYSYTEKFITTGFDMNPNHLAGISVSVPILSGGMRYSQVAQSKINLDIAQRNQDMVKDQLEIQNRQLLFNYENALENFNTQKENVEAAGRVYQSIQNKYQKGVASSFELTQENTNYLNAEGNYLNAILTLLQAQTALDKLYNRL